jgi:DNA modification methylase
VTTQRIIPGDCIEGLRTLPDASVHCCVTSPPYWGLRDYGHDGQIGLEPTPEAYVARMVEVFREVRRVLREDGTCWVNLGDSYNGIGGPGKQDGGPIGKTAAQRPLRHPVACRLRLAG